MPQLAPHRCLGLLLVPATALGVVARLEDDLRGPVLLGADTVGEVFLPPARVSQVRQLHPEAGAEPGEVWTGPALGQQHVLRLNVGVDDPGLWMIQKNYLNAMRLKNTGGFWMPCHG